MDYNKYCINFYRKNINYLFKNFLRVLTYVINYISINTNNV